MELDELELNQMELAFERISKDHPSRGKHAIANSIRHIKLAWKLRTVDTALAGFCCLNAEEEAASAVMDALQFHNYPGAERLDRRNHGHKWGLQQFIQAVIDLLAGEEHMFNMRCGVTKDDEVVTLVTEHAQGKRYQVHPPFNFSATIGTDSPTFQTELYDIARRHKFGSFNQHLAELKNRRNQLLYAWENGIPVADNVEEVVQFTKMLIFRNASLFIMIIQHPEHQPFVKDCLSSFIQALIAAKQLRA